MKMGFQIYLNIAHYTWLMGAFYKYGLCGSDFYCSHNPNKIHLNSIGNYDDVRWIAIKMVTNYVN